MRNYFVLSITVENLFHLFLSVACLERMEHVAKVEVEGAERWAANPSGGL